MMLKRFDAVPEAMLHVPATELKSLLGGPSLFYLKGNREPPLFITVLQHGNEPTGFDAMQQILQKYQGRSLPRSVWLFVANVDGAKDGLRVQPGQNDYNRSWPGTLYKETSEAHLMRQVVDIVTGTDPLFASIDLHNNTGTNPHYGCVNELAPQYLNLATLFARTVVFFRKPVGVQSLAMAQHCPSVTLECGQAGENAALDHAVEFLDACLHLQHLSDRPVAPHDISLLRTVAIAKMNEDISFSFGDGADDVLFRPDLDKLNFSPIEAGSVIAFVRNGTPMPIYVLNDDGQDIAEEIFEIIGGKLRLKKQLIPSMATLDTSIIRQDCLFYVMEAMTLD